jgi:hypothetical protein
MQGTSDHSLVPGQSHRERQYLVARPELLYNPEFRTEQAVTIDRLGLSQENSSLTQNLMPGKSILWK